MSRRPMHANEVPIDVPLVERLIEDQFPRLAARPITPVQSSGTVNAMFRLGDDLAVRMPRIESGVPAVEKEQRWLPTVAPFLPVDIPKPVGIGRPGTDYQWPWSVYTWIDGENPVEGLVTDPDGLAGDLTSFVTALHDIAPTDRPPIGRGEPLARRDAETRQAIDALAALPDGAGPAETDIDATRAAWDADLGADPWNGPPVLVHGDLMPGNLLLANNRLNAVIDFGSLGAGDPACDLIVAWNLLPAGSRGSFRAGLRVDDATWRRGRGSALSKAVIQLPYYRRSNPVMAANARHVIREVLDDHADGR